ncbi:MAG: translation initiation factor IF-6 [Candidatus Geothermarchaeota archaeon]
MIRLKIFGKSNIGLYLRATNSFVIYHSSIPSEKVALIENELKVTPVPVNLVNARIVSPFIAGNKSGAVISHILEETAKEELVKELKKIGVNVSILKDKYTSLGNLVLANDKGAIVSPVVSARSRRVIADTLDVEVAVTTIGYLSYIGSLAVANSSGAIISPLVKDEEKEVIEQVLKVNVVTGTVNKGSDAVALGIVVNDKGIVVSYSMTAKELLLLSQAFNL